jgi:hypothetical protein
VRKNILSVLIGFIFGVILIAALEGFFRMNQKFHWLAKSDVTNPHPPPPVDEKLSQQLVDDLAWAYPELASVKPFFLSEKSVVYENLDYAEKFPKGVGVFRFGSFAAFLNSKYQSRVMDKSVGDDVYNVAISTDQYGVRNTVQSAAPKNHNILFFGDSYVFGEGVPDDKTLPSQFAKLYPSIEAFNFGAGGVGPNDLLYEIEHTDSPRYNIPIPSRPSTAVFIFIDHDIDRVLCRMSCLKPSNSWILMKPGYKLNADRSVSFFGFFDEARPIRNYIYKLMSESALLDFFNVEYPPQMTESDFDLFTATINQLRIRLQEKWGVKDFVAIHYMDGSYYGPEFSKSFAKFGIRYISLDEVYWAHITGHRHRIAREGHPTMYSQFAMADVVGRKLFGPSPVLPTTAVAAPTPTEKVPAQK